MDWSNPAHIRRGSSLVQKLKYVLHKLLQTVTQLGKFFELVNFLGFMSQSLTTQSKPFYKRNISETYLDVALAREDPQQTHRSLSFQYVNILVVWTALGRSFANLLPFLDYSKLKSVLLGGSASLTQTFAFSSMQSDSAGDDSLCTVCGTTAICMPYRAMPCRCVFCYYCIQSTLQSGEKGQKVPCPKCTRPVTDGLQKYDLTVQNN